MPSSMRALLEEVSRDHFPAPPAPPEAIEAFERQMGWRLDPDLRAFYLHCDGAELFKRRPGCPYRILALSEIIRARLALRGRDLEAEGPASQYTLCDVQDGDYLLVDVSQMEDGRYAIVDGWHEAWPDPENCGTVARCFSEFLEKALRSKGQPFYLESDASVAPPKTSSPNAYGPLLVGRGKPGE